MNDDDFLQLFRALDGPLADVRRRLADLEQRPARAEVAGAVEVVGSLPAAGQPGRLLYQSADPAGLYADNGAGWDGPLRAVGQSVAARASRSSSQSVPGDATTVVNFDAVEFDDAGAITTGSEWAFTAPVAGRYLVTATVTLASNSSWAVGETARLELYRNSALYARLAMDANVNANTPVTLNGATLVELAAGDTVDIRVYQNSGGTLSISGATGHTHVSIVKV